MRAKFTAGLMLGISLSTGVARSQEPLWFSPGDKPRAQTSSAWVPPATAKPTAQPADGDSNLLSLGDKHFARGLWFQPTISTPRADETQADSWARTQDPLWQEVGRHLQQPSSDAQTAAETPVEGRPFWGGLLESLPAPEGQTTAHRSSFQKFLNARSSQAGEKPLQLADDAPAATVTTGAAPANSNAAVTAATQGKTVAGVPAPESLAKTATASMRWPDLIRKLPDPPAATTAPLAAAQAVPVPAGSESDYFTPRSHSASPSPAPSGQLASWTSNPTAPQDVDSQSAVRLSLKDAAASPSDKPVAVAMQQNMQPPQTGLLDVASMTGPSRDATHIFGDLQVQDNLRTTASLIATGPRSDASDFQWMPAAYTWISPAFYHKPLYFEQPNLERYGIGRSRVVQPIISSVHFFGSIPLVPYKTLTHHPREKTYTLGNGRPGNCVPVQRGVLLGQSTIGEVLMFWEECSGYGYN